MNHVIPNEPRAAMQLRGPSGGRGFTLVELLIVVGIVTVLIALLMPALSKARTMARQIQCASNLRNLVNYTFMYGNENRGVVPDWNNSTQVFDQLSATGGAMKYDAGDGTLNSFSVTGRNYLLSQGATEPLFYCPNNMDMDTHSGVTNNNWNNSNPPTYNYNTTNRPGILPSGSQIGVSRVTIGYTYYGGFTNWLAFNTSPFFRLANMPGKNLPIFSRKFGDMPDTQILWSDRSIGFISIGSSPASYGKVAFGANSLSNHTIGLETTAEDVPDGPGGSNEAFKDGHVEWVPQNQLVHHYTWEVATNQYQGYW